MPHRYLLLRKRTALKMSVVTTSVVFELTCNDCLIDRKPLYAAYGLFLRTTSNKSGSIMLPVRHSRGICQSANTNWEPQIDSARSKRSEEHTSELQSLAY